MIVMTPGVEDVLDKHEKWLYYLRTNNFEEPFGFTQYVSCKTCFCLVHEKVCKEHHNWHADPTKSVRGDS